MVIDILIIDDEADVRELIEETLALLKNKKGYESLGDVSSVDSVKEAKNFLKENPYKLIFLDNKIVREPDGITQAKELRNQTPHKIYICLHTTYRINELKKSQNIEETMPDKEFMKIYSLDRILEKNIQTLPNRILEVIQEITTHNSYKI
jgi:DNA-binding NtrC family response regulator